MPDPGTGFPSVPDRQPETPQEPTPDISAYYGSDYAPVQMPEQTGATVANYAHDVVTGKVAERGLERMIEPPPYDPNQSLAAKATYMPGLEQAANIALGFSGGGLGVQDLRMPSFPKPEVAPPKVNVISKQAAPFSNLAERYPETGPGKPTIDPKSKREYLAKEPTEQEKNLQKARNKAQADMTKYGYDPYYPLGQRFYVDPTNYPEVHYDTGTVLPKKQATIDEHLSYIGADETRRRLRIAYALGHAMPDAEHWYAMGQLEQDFVKILGPQEGRAAFRDHFTGAMAATTAGQAPTPNMLLGHYLGYLQAHQMPMPEAAWQAPHPLGGRYMMSGVEAYDKTYGLEGTGGFGELNPKRSDFQQSLLGYEPSYTWDEQMTGGATPFDPQGRPLAMPKKGTYGLYVKTGREEAERVGEVPRSHQDQTWAGFKQISQLQSGGPPYRPEPMMAHVNHAIERTHRVTGMDKDEIVHRGLVKREIPLYGLGMLSWLGYRGLDQGDQQ